MTLAFLEGLGSPLHWLVIAFVALLIFGRRLPEVGRSLGKGITEFKKGLKDVGNEDNSGQAQDPYQQNYNQQQIPPPNRAPQQYQQPYQQPQQRMPQQPAAAGPSQVRVTRNDMVD